MERKSLSDCSGPWSGFWVVDRSRGHMKLRLSFSESNIDGGGNDPIGSFSISGIYSQDGERVMFTKVYKTHATDYSGTWDGYMIYGRWTVQDELYTETGDFEIWPDREYELTGMTHFYAALGDLADVKFKAPESATEESPEASSYDGLS